MRIRSIKPEFWRSDDIASLSLEDRLLFIGIWSYVDDNGVGRDQAPLIAADLFAHDLSVDPTETLRRVSSGLERLYNAGLIARYRAEHGGQSRNFLEVTKWSDHQRIQNPGKPRYPRSDEGEPSPTETLRSPSVGDTNSLGPGAGEQGNRGTGEQGVVAESDDSDDDAQIPDPNDRDDVRELLDHLDAKIHEVDPEAKLPNRTKANADAARLLLDKDHRSIDQVKAAIDWALDDEFWRPNIRSMSKLRAKYDTLRGHAQRSRAGTPSAAERQYQISAERHERITQGQFGPRPEIENDPALWMPRQIEEA